MSFFLNCSYNEEVKRIVDESVDKLDSTAWTSLKNKTGARDTAVSAAETAAQVARATIGNTLHELIAPFF